MLVLQVVWGHRAEQRFQAFNTISVADKPEYLLSKTQL